MLKFRHIKRYIKDLFIFKKRYAIVIPVRGLFHRCSTESYYLMRDLQLMKMGECREIGSNIIDIETTVPYERLYNFCNINYVESGKEERVVVLRMSRFDSDIDVLHEVIRFNDAFKKLRPDAAWGYIG